MTYVKEFSNFIFKNGIIFLLCTAWCNFYIDNLIYSLILAGILTFAISSLIRFFLTKRSKKETLKTNEKTQMEKYMQQLSLHSKKVNEAFIKNMLTKLNIVFEGKIVAAFNKNSLTESEIYEVLKEVKVEKQILIFCTTAEPSAKIFAEKIENMKIELIEKENFFHLMKLAKIFPPEKIKFSKDKKISIKEFFNLLLNKQKAKTYLFFGFLMLFSSYVTYLKFYYLIFASIFFSLALVSLMFGNVIKKESFIINSKK